MKDFKLFLSDLGELISFKSVSADKVGDAPFGVEVYKALTWFIKKAVQYGFDTINYDNYAGEVFFGSGEEIGIMGHLDVVPEGSGWNYPPFNLTEKDGYLIGRGVLDDKLPTLLILYALKELKEEGVVFNRKIRLFLGCDEEKGWKDVEHLKSKTIMPKFGFSPDGDFPVSYAEKGMAIIEFKLPKLKNFYNVRGGTVINAVPAVAYSDTKLDFDYKTDDITANKNKVIAYGVSSHGAYPEQGKNAIKRLLEFFLENGENVSDVLDCLFYDKLNLKGLTSEQGFVTLSPNLIYETDNNVIIKCDCRYPYPFTDKDIEKVIKRFGLEYTLTVKHGTQYVDKNGFLVDTLINAYNKITKQNGVPISQRGSTFARVFECGVAFGPEFPLIKSTIHEPNERVKIKDVLKMFDIYKTAIKNLVK